MFKSSKIIGLIIAIMIIAFAVLKFNQLIAPESKTDANQLMNGLSPEEQTELNKQKLITGYLKNHINELSTVPAVLGGNFHITNIQWLDNNRVLIDYEDGHISLTARASYQLAPDQPLAITDFQIIKQNGELINQQPIAIKEDDLMIVDLKNKIASQHEKNFADITINIEQQNQEYIRGHYSWSDEDTAPGLFLAKLIDNELALIYDGDDNFDCQEIADYNFPESIVPECAE